MKGTKVLTLVLFRSLFYLWNIFILTLGARVKPGSQYDAGASVKSAEHNQRRIVNEFYVGTLGALVRATATKGRDSISIRALASVTFR